MIYNTTHNNKEAKAQFNDLLGKPYSFLKAIKMGGIGSKRMIIEQVSSSFQKYMNTVSDINYGNIEIREKGIIVHITKGLQNFSWAIPTNYMFIKLMVLAYMLRAILFDLKETNC
jgi:hypothetical protein